jgi:hypothetical protein
MPKQPMGATFLVAVSLLGLFALVQVVAVAARYLPQLREQVIEARDREAGTGPQPPSPGAATQPAQSPQPAQLQQPAADPATIAQAAQAVSEADKHFRVGDFEASLRLLQRSEAWLPTDPAIQFRLGRTYDALDDKNAALAAFERSLAVPGLPAEVRRDAEQKIALLRQVLGDQAPAAAAPSTPGATALAPPAGGASMRDDIGLQPGSVLGIVDARLRDGQPGTKNLRVAVKSRPGKSIDASAMNVFVYFYEMDGKGEVVITDSRPATQWISPPVDWSDAEPEILDVEYLLPDSGLPGSSADFGSTDRKFYGYVVGVYYGGELQDTRADPGRLSSIAEMPLYLENQSN